MRMNVIETGPTRGPAVDRSVARATPPRVHRDARLAAAAVLLAALSLVVAGCFARTGLGDIQTDIRTVAPFTRIEVSDRLGALIRIGPAKPLEVNAQGNLLSIIATDVEGGTLRIHGTESFINTQPAEVVISVPSLAGVILSGSAYASVEGLAADAFDVTVSGSSHVVASGTSTTVALLASGSSEAMLEMLIAKTITVDVSGSSQATIDATDVVRGSASGSAHITVGGGATVNVTRSGGSTVTSD